MNNSIFQNRGFALIAVIIAILIIAVIAFGAMNWKGQVQQNKEIENKAVNDLKVINDNLQKNNQEIQSSLKENNTQPDAEQVNTQNTTQVVATDGTLNWQTYKNDEHGFEVKYPKDWRSAQCGIDCQGFGPQNVPEDIATAINVINSKLDIAKKSLPVLSNFHNKIINEETVIIKEEQWVKLIIKSDINEEIFIHHLIEKNGKTYDLGVGTDEPNIVNIYNQILATFKFTE